MNRITQIIIILIFCAFGSSCKSDSSRKTKQLDFKSTNQQLEHINKLLAQKDREEIEAYIERHELEGVQENKAGLFYLIWGKPTGEQVETHDIVVINYTVSLLDGTKCYSTRFGPKKEFLVGKGGVESGLEMAILLMKEGQHGKFIFPSHLGHGIIGDNNKIPPLAVLVFDVDLLTVVKN